MNYTNCIVALCVVWLSVSGTAFAADFDCDKMRADSNFGDYRDPQDADYLRIVERGHFDSDVERLIKGLSVVDPMGDINYTLRRFPNHYRALNSMSRYYFENGERWRRKGRQKPECYFQLAEEWQPDDGIVRLLYGIHLHRMKRYDEAGEKYQEAIGLMPKSAEVHYNLGLLYIDMNQAQQARAYAITAYKLGYPLPGLRDRLRDRGFWTEDDDQALLGQAVPAAGND